MDFDPIEFMKRIEIAQNFIERSLDEIADLRADCEQMFEENGTDVRFLSGVRS